MHGLATKGRAIFRGTFTARRQRTSVTFSKADGEKALFGGKNDLPRFLHYNGNSPGSTTRQHLAREHVIHSNCKGGGSVILCDLCGQARECLQKEIEGREFDICADCWRPLEEKLKGKGRVRREREMVVLPARTAPEIEEPGTAPGSPPKIFGEAARSN
jgi:hypothetical protein